MNRKTETEVSKALQDFAKHLDDELERRFGSGRGFILITFPFDQQRVKVQYLSNCERADRIAVLQVLLELWKSGALDIPEHVH